jgi:hypothetical protein
VNKPIMPAELEPAYVAYMGLPLEQRLKQLAADVSRVARNDFEDAEEAQQAMRLNVWQLEWIGYAMEVDIEVVSEMVDLYRFLGRWSKRWAVLEADPKQMAAVQDEAKAWEQKSLEWVEI